MAFDHLFWGYKQVANGILVEGLEGYKDDWKISEGVDLSAEFPSDAYFAMNPEFPDSTIPTDHVRNQNNFVVISERLKQLLEAHGVKDVQYLQVGIKDHKGKLVSAPHFIVNPTRQVACFDEAQSEPTFSDLDEDKIEKMEAFVPDDEVCKDLPDVVRPKGFYHLLISRSLAKKIDAAGMTGSGYVEPDRLLGDDIPVSLRGLTRK